MAIDPLNEELDKEDNTKFTLDKISPMEMVKRTLFSWLSNTSAFPRMYVIPEPNSGSIML